MVKDSVKDWVRKNNARPVIPGERIVYEPPKNIVPRKWTDEEWDEWWAEQFTRPNRM